MKRIFSIILFVLLALSVSAQDHRIQRTGRPVITQKKRSTNSSFSKKKREEPKITTQEKSPTDPDGFINGHGYVDLGLSVKWATCNIGSDTNTEYGSYFAWGETSVSMEYSESNYEFYENQSYQFIGNDISGTQYDAARRKWGAPWRMPTAEEFQELLEKCSWTWIYGYYKISRNGKCIFLPAAGTVSINSHPKPLSGEGIECSYWSSSHDKRIPYKAWHLWCQEYDNSKFKKVGEDHMRYVGLPIRPVAK